jgi:hypothetical protein
MPLVIFTSWAKQTEIIKWYAGQPFPNVDVKKITHIRMNDEELDVYLPLFRDLKQKWIGQYVYFAYPESHLIYKSFAD